MLIVFFLLFGVSLLIFTRGMNNEPSIWVASMILAGAFGVFAVYIHDNAANIQISYEILKKIEYLFSSFMYYFNPYLFLMLSISNIDNSKYLHKKRAVFSVLFFLPILMMYVLVYNRIGFEAENTLLVAWATPYILTGAVLLYHSFRSCCYSMEIKRQKLLYCIIFIPIMLFSLITNYWEVRLGLFELWRYGIQLLYVLVCLILFFMIKFGFAGFRIRIEQQQTEQRINAITLGMNSLIHAIKNRALLTKYEIENLIEDIEENKDISKSEINEKLNGIVGKTDHLLGLINEISKKLNNRRIVKTNCMMSDIIDESLALISPMIDKSKYLIEKEYSGSDIEIFGDRHLLIEMLINLYKNSIEAMKTGGVLRVRYINDKRNVYLYIEDNGEGIKKENLKRVTDPLYSTKGGENFGIGLSFCYNVIRQHKGNITFRSSENEGTAVNITLPVRNLQKEEVN